MKLITLHIVNFEKLFNFSLLHPDVNLQQPRMISLPFQYFKLSPDISVSDLCSEPWLHNKSQT